MKRIWDSNANCLMAIDGEFEFNSTTAYNLIKQWKKSYFRKNSKIPCTIQLRCNFAPPMPDYWKYWIECVRGGKINQTRICQEAYEFLKGRDNPVEELGQVEFVVLEQFEPNEKDKPINQDS